MNVLIIAHFFYPYCGVAAKRMTALATFLSREKHNVSVIRANDYEYTNMIVNDNDDVHCNIYPLKKYLNIPLWGRIVGNYLYSKKILGVLKENNIDIVIFSGGPFSYFCLAKKIKKFNQNIACVLDFRDIVDGKNCSNNKKSFSIWCQYNLDLLSEKIGVKYADLCLTVTPTMNEFYCSRYPENMSKFITIYNGYDNITVNERCIKELESFNQFENNTDEYCIGIFGKFVFYDFRFAEILVNAIRRLKDEGFRIYIKQFGVEENELRQLFASKNISDVYCYIPSEGYSKDIIKLQKCDITMACSYVKEALGTKIFDYIWVNRPIVIICDFSDGEQERVIREFEHGYICRDSDELYDSLKRIISLKSLVLDDESQNNKFFSREFQFKRLLETLYTIIND